MNAECRTVNDGRCPSPFNIPRSTFSSPWNTMPELPDIVVYVEAIASRTVGTRLERVRLASPFLLRSVDPPLASAEGKVVQRVCRIGKRIAIGVEDDLWLVLHLMIAGRLHWKPSGAALSHGHGLAAFDFTTGTLTLTEAGSRKRASLIVVRGDAALRTLDRGGVDVLASPLEKFRQALAAENHTLKRALTDPRLFDGIGNAYSDEILHVARLSPLQLTRNLTDDETARLFAASRDVLTSWIERLRAEAARGFPEKVTAFRKEFAVHGRFNQPCPTCGAPVQRIVYRENEANYCARCQTGGRRLADRALSRLLREDWPRRLDDDGVAP
jgi:formamidopyrimidine-DNA glycosylase